MDTCFRPPSAQFLLPHGKTVRSCTEGIAMEQMWSSCHPQTEEELIECAALGKSLSRLSQPTILTLLAANDKPMHGYIIVQQAANSPMFGGKKPDATGIYRALKRMEEAGLVHSWWDTPSEGSAKRQFELTDKGRQCLRRWIDALACYKMTIEELRVSASTALGIDVPPAPYCAHAKGDLNIEMNNRGLG